ncbi:MAG: zf-HC2 domain-containing protein [Actinobacteria bacterium]|nr:zf-HC2 domain-containing protein [Actinomycetota bacterium]
MDCREAKRYLPSYLSEEYEGFDRRSFEAHLAACASCRSELAAFARLDKFLAGVPVDLPPEDFTVGVIGAISAIDLAGSPGPAPDRCPVREVRKPPWKYWWIPRFTDWAVAMAATVTLFVAGYNVVFGTLFPTIAGANLSPRVQSLTDQFVTTYAGWWPQVQWIAAGLLEKIWTWTQMINS